MPTREASSSSIAALIQLHLEELQARRRAPDTQRQARAVLQRFARELPQDCRRDGRLITEAHVVRFLARLGPVSAGTRRAYLVKLRSFFGSLCRRGLLWSSPARSVAAARVEQLPRNVPSQAQTLRVLRGAGSWAFAAERDQAIIEVLYGSGLRRSECVRLDLSDVDLAESTLLVRNGKGRKDRVVPLTGRARQAIAAYLTETRPRLASHSSDSALFLSVRGGRRLGATGLARMVGKITREADVRGVSAHSLRHACATHLLQGGASVRAIQRLLGHKRITTTARYTRVEPREVARMLRRCHPRERRAKAPRLQR